MWKGYGKILLEEQHDDKPFCVVAACVKDSKLQNHREDYCEWEMNRRTGTVECDYYLDEANTEKLRELLEVNTSAELIAANAKKCRSRSGISYTGNSRSLCDDNGVEYDYKV